MSERLLSDAELLACWGRASGSMVVAGREVEAAVLEKVRGRTTCFASDGVDASALTESECRRRERAAYTSGWTDHAEGGWSRKDERYPAPTVTRPREIVLSNGWRYRTINGKWRYMVGGGWSPMLDEGRGPPCYTAEDARKVAECWEHPTEEVEG